MNNESKTISIGKTKFKVINLTEPLREDVQVYPGDPKVKKEILSTFETNDFQYNVYSIGDHHFHPHGDAKKHFSREHKNIGFENWDLDYVFNDAVMLDLSEDKDAIQIDGIKFTQKIKYEHLAQIENELSKKSALIIRTGYDKWLEENSKHIPQNIPYFTKEAADKISELENIKVIGTDSLTVDKVASNYVHKKFKNIFIVECLVNLNNIPKDFRNNFTLQTSPIAIVGATGGPVLAYVYVQNT